MNDDFKIRGVYTFHINITTMFINETLRITNTNLITLKGKSFFLHRWIDNEFEPIKYIVLGKGTARPLESDSSLGSETCRKLCNMKVYPKQNLLEISCNFTAKEVVDTSEIGVCNDKLLISHDLYETLSANVIGDLSSNIYLTYNFYISPGSLRNYWQLSEVYKNSIYYIYEPNNVSGVLEYNTGSGYVRKNDINALKSSRGSYYYDKKSRNLYIRTSDDSNPNYNEIIVQN